MGKLRVVIALITTMVVSSLQAQEYQASLDVGVQNSNGEPLAGVTVNIKSRFYQDSMVTKEKGQARFGFLPPGTYVVWVNADGFESSSSEVTLEAGDHFRVPLTLYTYIEEFVSVTYVDMSEMSTTTHISTDELEQIPQARDPWSILETIPAIQNDRVNVGGNEAAERSAFVGHGDDGSNTQWSIDGVDITDFVDEGASQTYLDFGSFREIGFTTAGKDVTNGASGTVINFVTKQGTNDHSGSMRLLYADRNFSSTNLSSPDPVDGQIKQNKIVETFEKGFEIGGPILKDKLWYWGAFSQNSVDNLTRSGQRDKSVLEHVSVKLHGDITPTTRGTFFYTEGRKIAEGREAGPTRAPETTWDQDGPTPIYKYEISQLIGSHTDLRYIHGRVDGGFNLAPQADPNTNQALFDNAAGTWRNTFYALRTARDQRTHTLKGKTFLSWQAGDHEFDYGFEYKDSQATTAGSWGTEQNIWLSDYSALGGPSYFFAYRDSVVARELESNALWVQDTFTRDNLTLKAGVRYNQSEGRNLDGNVAANNFFPDLLPALDYRGDQPDFTWETLSPSLGAAYSVGTNSQVVLRGNVRRYYDNLSAGEVDFDNPVALSALLGLWADGANGQPLDGQFQVGEEVWFGGNPYAATLNVNPENPAAASSIDRVDANLEPPRVDELILSGEWYVHANFTLGVSFTHRRRDRVIASQLQGGITSGNYELLGEVTGVNPVNNTAYSVPVYGLDSDGLALNPNRANILTNRRDYEEVYDGIEFTVRRRLTDRWMLRGYLAYQNWVHDVGAAAFQNPTMDVGRQRVDGGDVAIQSNGAGPKDDVWLGTASWSANLNALVQLPCDTQFSTNIFAREGYAAPLVAAHNIRAQDGRPIYPVSPGPLDTLRMDDLFVVNTKVSKLFLLGQTRVDLGLEIFNLFNDDALIQVQRRIAMGGGQPDPTFGRVEETLSPRIARFSATIHF